jgi:hypothetical protein
MTQINITLEEEILKDLFMGNREKSMSILLEQVINAVLNKQATEIDRNFLFVGRSILSAVLYVKKILATRYGMLYG